jgi:hypothetical protein
MKKNHIQAWLTNAAVSEYMGRTAGIKLAVLLHLMSGEGSLVEIARRFSVSRQALTKHVQLARQIFDL